MKIQIKALTFRNLHGRTIAFANVVDEAERIIFSEQLSNCLIYCQKNNLSIINTDEILNTLVLKMGFAA
jgi:hypothetical protein